METPSQPAEQAAPSSSQKPNLLRTLLATGSIVIISLSLLFFFPPKTIRSLLDNSTDLLLRTSRMPTSEIAVVIVEIDETSLKSYGQWPWPRNLIAELLDAIHRAGATSIGINIIFPERDRSSPCTARISPLSSPGLLPIQRTSGHAARPRSDPGKKSCDRSCRSRIRVSFSAEPGGNCGRLSHSPLVPIPSAIARRLTTSTAFAQSR
jgi:hypothetical protein